jgi:hypothetical protein
MNVTGSGSDTLAFTGRHDGGEYGLDDIELTAEVSQPPPVPEPGSIVLLQSILFAAAMLYRRARPSQINAGSSRFLERVLADLERGSGLRSQPSRDPPVNGSGAEQVKVVRAIRHPLPRLGERQSPHRVPMPA